MRQTSDAKRNTSIPSLRLVENTREQARVRTTFAVREGKEIAPTGVGITGTRRGNSRVLPSAIATLHDAIRCDVSRPKEIRTPHGRDHAHHARKYPAVQQHRLSSQVFATACDAAPRRVSSLRPLPLRDPFTLIHFLYGVHPSISSRFVFLWPLDTTRRRRARPPYKGKYRSLFPFLV